jgi:hypothetical protein
MPSDALTVLREAGNPVDLLTEQQQAVLAQLSDEEVRVLIAVKERLDAASDSEVEGHASVKIV